MNYNELITDLEDLKGKVESAAKSHTNHTTEITLNIALLQEYAMEWYRVGFQDGTIGTPNVSFYTGES